MRTALVLGGGGFVGSHLAARLKRDGYHVTCVDVHPPMFGTSAADEFVLGDLRDPEVCRAVVRLDFDEIYQLAANMGGAGYIFTGEHDTDILLDSATINVNVQRAYRGSSARLLFASSACVYPAGVQRDPEHPDCAELNAYPADPDSEYGWEKLFAERVYGALNRSGPGLVSIASLHNVFGPDGVWRGGREKAPAAICRKVAAAGNGHHQDLGRRPADALVPLHRGMHRGPAAADGVGLPRPINLGSSERISIAGLTRMIVEISGKEVQVAFGESGPEGVRGRCSDNRLIMRQLGWQPSLPLRAGLEPTYAWVERQVQAALADSVAEPAGVAGR